MRTDSLGLFWADYALANAGSRERIRPPVPDTGWRRPSSFPNLSNASVIGIDIETYDPHLTTLGAGNVRFGDDGKPDGYIVGVSVATDDKAWYFPLRHPDSDNIPEAHFYAWAKREFARVTQPKVGANLMYDVGWLRAYGVEVAGALFDVQCAEPLLDEESITYDLDYLAHKYLGHGKETDVLYNWMADAFGGKPDGSQRANIWRTPASLVGPYAEEDARAPLEIMRHQWAELKRQDLINLFKLETSLLPLLIRMRERGVRVDMERADAVRKDLHEQAEIAQEELNALAGNDIRVSAASSIAQAFDDLGIKYPRTRRGQPSFKAAWLKEQGHAVPRKIVEVRKIKKIADTFIDSYIFKHAHNGRIFPTFHPLRTDANGTVSGRFAASNPNLQNVPSRDEVLAALVRGLFLPDEGHKWWRRYDYSQIEYRFLAHFASGRGAEDVRDRYRKDPNIDFHAMVTRLIDDIAHILLPRGLTKNVNFGLVYGMALDTLRAYIGVSSEEAERIFGAYHAGAPFIKHTYDAYMHEAHGSGYVLTVLQRRRRFKWYESAVAGVNGAPLPREAAKRAYGHIKPAYTHKALNAVLQGSAADLIKQAMADAYYSGVFDVTGVPHLQVHDELDFSDDGSPAHDEAFAELTHIMENCMRLRVPVKVDTSRGPNWGKCK